jgi:hypothetical protein
MPWPAVRRAPPRPAMQARSGPDSELEEGAIGPVYRAFRVDMTAWQLADGRRSGRYDLAMIERQLSRTGTAPP